MHRKVYPVEWSTVVSTMFCEEKISYRSRSLYRHLPEASCIRPGSISALFVGYRIEDIAAALASASILLILHNKIGGDNVAPSEWLRCLLHGQYMPC